MPINFPQIRSAHLTRDVLAPSNFGKADKQYGSFCLWQLSRCRGNKFRECLWRIRRFEAQETRPFHIDLGQNSCSELLKTSKSAMGAGKFAHGTDRIAHLLASSETRLERHEPSQTKQLMWDGPELWVLRAMGQAAAYCLDIFKTTSMLF